MKSLDFFVQFNESVQQYYGTGVNTSSDRNEYQESSWG
jgi:hypothetical protein